MSWYLKLNISDHLIKSVGRIISVFLMWSHIIAPSVIFYFELEAGRVHIQSHKLCRYLVIPACEHTKLRITCTTERGISRVKGIKPGYLPTSLGLEKSKKFSRAAHADAASSSNFKVFLSCLNSLDSGTYSPFRTVLFAIAMAASIRRQITTIRTFHRKRIDLWNLSIRRMSMNNLNIVTLEERGIFQTVFPPVSKADLENCLTSKPQCMYCGFDPTADSLHVGNLLAIVALLHCQRAGHKTIAVIGGATAQIGDPSGKTKEREALEINKIQHNILCIEKIINNIFHNHLTHFYKPESQEISPVKILNNYDWYRDQNFVGFLSTVGRHFRMSDLLSRTSVQTRLQSSEGMSLTEFTYQVFQAFDWLHLYRTYDCNIQIGGNDQIGNIVSGSELVHKVTRQRVYGLTVPLIKSTTGDKLGKTAGNAVWLSAEKTTPFELYQYFFNFADADVSQFLKLFTFLPDEEINDILKEHEERPELRVAQKKLAESVTLLVHGSEGLESALRCTEVFFNKSVAALSRMSESELMNLFRNTPTYEMSLSADVTLLDAVMAAGCFGRKVDAERVIRSGGVYINQERIKSEKTVITKSEHVLNNGLTLIRTGKKNYTIIKWLEA